jgi:hypothetical protein
LVGSFSEQFVSFIISSCGHEDSDVLHPYMEPHTRMFYESLRQQLMKGCGWVCPYGYKKSPCCGRKESMERLYQRLPEKYKKQIQLPICVLGH